MQDRGHPKVFCVGFNKTGTTTLHRILGDQLSYRSAHKPRWTDWSITKKANVLYNSGYAVVAYPGVAKPVKHFPEGILKAMINNDFEFAANNRKRILKEWQKRYDSKSEPKKK